MITEGNVENFINHHKRRGVKNSTIWHYIVDLKALFYWAMEKQHRFVTVNPVARLFEKIKRVTSFNVYLEKNPNTPSLKAWKELKSQNYPGGVKLTTKELRDYFATQVSAQVTDPNTVKNLMRHTSLNTTSRSRTVTERMKEAVQNLGKPLEASLEGNSLRKKTQNDILTKLAIEGLRARIVREKAGGGGRSRTYDAADMSRVL